MQTEGTSTYYPRLLHFWYISFPRISRSQVNEAMSAALEPFHQYIQSLAEGKLDCYFNSMPPMDIPDLGVQFPKANNLLLHDLGNHPDEARLRCLFETETTSVLCVVFMVIRSPHFAWYSHLFAVSGSGKTRLTLEGRRGSVSTGVYIYHADPAQRPW